MSNGCTVCTPFVCLLRFVVLIYGYIVCVCCILLGFVGALMARLLCLGHKRANWMKELLVGRCLVYMMRLCCIYTLEVRGADKLSGNESFVVVANHQSTLDNAVLTFLHGASPSGEKKYLTKSSYYRIPIFGWTQWLAGDISVDLRSPASRRQSMADCSAALHDGSSVVVYPEGTRNQRVREVGLLPFKKGAFRIAHAANVRLLPVCIFGTIDGMGTGCRCDPLLSIAPASLCMSVGEPISFNASMSDEDAIGQATDAAFQWIQKEYRSIAVEYGRAPPDVSDERVPLTNGTAQAPYGGST
eukprot:TRINITY_DN14884_c0_g1_i1.p1 TRINITY_DN14884_c0_g1~~TRINITY_DN14884_c0_g1_i1.p1  ORF type:complete len:301 (+),score=29.19 TRINITY_DN14884_c0_g1_i1:119-1021(+)